METKKIHVVSCASSTLMQDIPWHEERYIFKIDCDPFPEKAATLVLHPEQMPKNEEESQEYLAGLTYLTETYNQVISWVHASTEAHDLAIYCMSEQGLFRSVIIAKKIAELLSSQGCDVDLIHNELRARGIQ